MEEQVITVPHESLSPQTLAALIEEFVTRDGAVHGHADESIDRRRESVLAQLRAGTILIVFDAEDDSVGIVAKPTGRDASR